MRAHWPEYVSEAAGLGLFMVSACVFATALSHPASRLVQALPDPLVRRMLMGLAMGTTAVALIYSPWGRRSGAHLNPATTLTFWRLGKVATPDVPRVPDTPRRSPGAIRRPGQRSRALANGSHHR
jgi:aquaporin Z